MFRWKTQWGLYERAWDTKQGACVLIPPLHSPAAWPNSLVRVLILVMHPAKMRLGVSAVMDLPLFASSSSFHWSRKWELFNQSQHYNECCLWLHLIYWFALNHSSDMNAASDLLCSESGVTSDGGGKEHTVSSWNWVISQEGKAEYLSYLKEGVGEGMRGSRKKEHLPSVESECCKGPWGSSHFTPWWTEEEADVQGAKVTFLSSRR